MTETTVDRNVTMNIIIKAAPEEALTIAQMCTAVAQSADPAFTSEMKSIANQIRKAIGAANTNP